MALGLWQKDDRSRVDTLLSDINNAAIASATGAHWEEKTNGLVELEHRHALDGHHPRPAGAVRRQEPARAERRALADGGAHRRPLGDDARDGLGADRAHRLDGRDGRAEGRLCVEGGAQHVHAGRRHGHPRHGQAIHHAAQGRGRPAARPGQRAGHLAQRHAGQSGDGRLYYSAYLKTYVPVEDVRSLSRGVVVARQYFRTDDPCFKDPKKACTPVTSAKVGDVLQVKLSIVAPNDLYYVVVEDPLPAGTEAVDTSLKTTSQIGQAPKLSPRQSG